MNDLNQLNKYLESVLTEFGLQSLIKKDAAGSFIGLHAMEDSVMVYLGFKLEQQARTDNWIQCTADHLNKLESDIKNSYVVKNILKKPLQEIETLKDSNSKLKFEVERLRQFEVYYNLHFKMQHGDK